ncbi:hypothetical protein H311_00500, partial [Anncaliia algerae PRA109]
WKRQFDTDFCCFGSIIYLIIQRIFKAYYIILYTFIFHFDLLKKELLTLFYTLLSLKEYPKFLYMVILIYSILKISIFKVNLGLIRIVWLCHIAEVFQPGADEFFGSAILKGLF